MTTISVTLGYYTLPMPDKPVVGMVFRCPHEDPRFAKLYVVTAVLQGGAGMGIRFLGPDGEDNTRSWSGAVEHDEYLGQVPPEMFGVTATSTPR